MSMTAADNRISRGEANEPAIDWRERTQDAWNDPAWREAAAEYQLNREERPLVVESDSQRRAQLRRFLDNSVSLERAWAELNNPRNRPTPQVTIEAIMYCVGERGVAALTEPGNGERLKTCDAAAKRQIRERIARLTRERGEP